MIDITLTVFILMSSFLLAIFLVFYSSRTIVVYCAVTQSLCSTQFAKNESYRLSCARFPFYDHGYTTGEIYPPAILR